MESVKSLPKWVVAGTAVCGALLALLLAAALPPAAGALTSHFSIDNGAGYTRYPGVALGDGGYSPFFQPGVVVWDGGSIISGHGADPGYEFPTQTLSLVPRFCTSFVSSTGSAKIADMLATAPTEVDAHYRPNADLDLCLVLAGGGDFRAAADPGYVYDGLKAYCLARRAAGFKVIVLTVLPSSYPITFEASRTVFNERVRTTWMQFADGLVDIAADPRIGDSGDNLDQQFFLADALHLNTAGNAVMATVAAPIVNALPWLSASCEMRMRDADGVWSAWRPYVATSSWQLPAGDGKKTVEAEYQDGHGTVVAVSDSIMVDTVRPTTVALRDVRVRRKATVTLPYRVDDAAPCGPTATVVVTVARGATTVREFVQRRVPIGVPQSVRFAGSSLSKGTYRYTVTARDAAGNAQSIAGSARLILR